MKSARMRDNEDHSLAALRALQVLDTPPEAAFDALVSVASAVCGVPISLISLIDVERQWFKANVGLPGVTETPRDVAFCAHAVLDDELFEVPDAALDARFADNPLVRGQPDIRFYAGAPLRLGDGTRVGTLCVIDREPRLLTPTQHEVLRQLATAAAHMLEGRAALRQHHQATLAVATSEYNLRLVVDNIPSMLAYWNADLTCRFANRAYETWFGEKGKNLVGSRIEALLGPELFNLNKPHVEAALRGQPQTFERMFTLPDGSTRQGLLHYVPDVVDNEVMGFLAETSDVTPIKNIEAALRTEMAERERVLGLLQERSAALEEAQRLGGIGSWAWQVAGDDVSWSPELFRILGCDPASGAPGFADQARLFQPESYARLHAAVAQALQTGQAYSLELQFVRSDGQQGWLETRAETLRDEHGRVVRLQGTVQDITERRRMAAELTQQHELLHVTLQSIGDAVITTNAMGSISWLNPVAERMTGWLANEARGLPLAQVFNIVNQDSRAVAQNPVAVCLADDKVVGLAHDTLLISRDGREFGIEDSASPIRNEAGAVLGAVLVFHDVSEQRRMSGEMTYRATHDALTGLVNRAEFETRLQRVLRKSQEELTESALLYIDLDQFKLVNDACGHAIGDQLLQQVSKLLGDAVRTRDTLARLGGDEFGIILEHCAMEQAQRVAQKICDQMDHFRFIHEDRRFRIGTSIGLVPVDKRWASTAALQQAADTSCYAAKEAGRNRVHVWFDTDASMHARGAELQWTARIERALDDDGFRLYAQQIKPLTGAAGGIHAEVLLRMHNDDGSISPPGAFLPAAERFHLVSRVDRWVLARALAWMKALPSPDLLELLSVNLSGQSVGDRAFHAWAITMLAEAGPAVCSRLCLEITETAAVTNLADAAVFITSVRAAGVRVALDDFGAGASSFGYLKTLPVDFLKIDGQFIHDLVTDPLNDVAVRCFVDVARVMGLKTVAEFVDQTAVLARLKEIGVDYAQGYLIHKPEPLGALLDLAMIYNYRAVDETLGTSGQPTAAQLGEIARAGFRTVINLAPHDDPRQSLPDEEGTVHSLGMHYVHIPVQFATPTRADLLAFFDAMDAHQGEKVWVHCAANMRVPAFLGLYRVLRQGGNPAQAFDLMHDLWQPDVVWSTFIAQVLTDRP